MKKFIFFGIAVLFLISFVSAENLGDFILSSYDSGDTGQNGVNQFQFVAQTFTVGINGTNGTINFTGFEIKGYAQGNPPLYTVKLYDVNDTGDIQATVLSTNSSVDLDHLGATPGIWTNITMPSIQLAAGGKYAIALEASGGDGSNKANWRNGNGYGGGNAYLNLGAGWVLDGGNDMLFRVRAEQQGVQLITPEDNANFYESTKNFTAYVIETPNDINKTELVIWYPNDSIYYTDSQFFGNTSTNTTFTVSGIDLGEYTWNIFAYDNSTVHYSISNYSFSRGAEFSDYTFENSVLETSTQNFRVNITVDSGISVLSSKIEYNKTNYTVTNRPEVATNVFELNKNISIPAGKLGFSSEIRFFNWYVTLVEETSGLTFTQVSTQKQQTVNEILFTKCNTTYPINMINFTSLDENNETLVNVTFESSFNYWIGDGTVKKNYSYSDYNQNESQVNFCASPANYDDDNPLYINMQMEYQGSSYDPREYYLEEAALTNVSTAINLYSLESALSQKFYITVQDGVEDLTNVLVFISKYFVGEGTYKTIGVRETDENGLFVEYLEDDKQYRFTIVDNGETLGVESSKAICSSTPCELSLQIQDALVEAFAAYSEAFAGNVLYNLTFDDATDQFIFTYVDVTGLAQYARMVVERQTYNVTRDVICDTSLYSSSGTISCNLSGQNGDFVATTYISRSPEKIVSYLAKTLSNAVDTLGLTGLFVSLLIIITVVFAFIYDYQLGVIAIPISFILLKITTILGVSWITIAGICIVCGIIAALMGRSQ